MLYSSFNEREDSITMYDENGNEMSMFVLDEDASSITITEYRNLTGKPQKYIVLPSFNLEKDRELTEDEIKQIEGSSRLAEKYIYGKIRLGKGLFVQYNNITIVAQQQAPIAIEEGCFDVGSNYNFILPRNMTLFDVNKVNEFYPEGFPSHYVMIGDKRLNLNYCDASNYRTKVTEKSGRPELNRPNVYVNPKYFVEDGHIKDRTKIMEQ